MGALEGTIDQWSQIPITLKRSWIWIRIRIKIKSWIRIKVKNKPDPQSSKKLDPDLNPRESDADPQPCMSVPFLTPQKGEHFRAVTGKIDTVV